MKARRPQILLLVAFAGSVLASIGPIALSFQELSSLRERVQAISGAASIARQARTVGERISTALTDFAAFSIELDPKERASILSATDKQMLGFRRDVTDLERSIVSWIDDHQHRDLLEASSAIAATWNTIRSKSAGELAPPEKGAHFLELVQNVKRVQAVLRTVEAHSTGLADAQYRQVFERLGLTATFLVSAIALGFLISSFGSLSIFHSLEQTRKASDALEEAESKLRLRTEQLVEAQNLGKLGDWQILQAHSEYALSAEIYKLLRLDPATFRPTLRNVRQLFAADTLRRIVHVQYEVIRTGNTRSLDVRVRCGDGSLRDFTLTCKPLVDGAGRTLGLFGTLQDISERKAAEEQLKAIAYYDPLTGLANRALFTRELDDVLQRTNTINTPTSLLLLDLDRFKEVNDTLGHGAGDELLLRVGHIVSRILGNRHFLARLGGDEFAIIIEERLAQPQLAKLATEIVAALSGTIMLERGEVTIGTSIGIVMAPADGRNSTDLLRNADLALYSAKESGRGRFAFFTPELDTAVQYKTALANDLRRAVANNAGLSINYQPQIDLATGHVIGFESLLRWTHPVRGEVSPAEFVPIAESSSLICDLGNWILREAATQAKTWLDAGAPPREVSVNVSAAQIWHSDLVSEVQKVLQDTGLPPHLLCLELTESLMADHGEGRVRTALRALKQLGVTLALDDFGTDYSSLGYLAQLPIDKLKVDRVFVDGVATSHRSRELLKGIIALGRGLGMSVVAEGAELPEEVAFLRAAGCDIVQGHVFARAIPAVQARMFADACDMSPALGVAEATQDPDALVAHLRRAVA